MDHALFAYPWDLLDDPGAADEIAELGFPAVSLAAVQHSARVLMPHNPSRKVLTVEHAAAYVPIDPNRYGRLRPRSPSWTDPVDSFGRAADSLRAAGLGVNAWTVVTHSSVLGRENPDLVVCNAFGDRYTYALCPAQPAVQEYAQALIADVVGSSPLDSLELEACGYMGVAHQSHHDKAGMTLDGLHAFLLSLCFCPACTERWADHGADPDSVRHRVTRALQAHFHGQPSPVGPDSNIEEALGSILGRENADAVLDARDEATFDLLEGILAVLPRRGPPEVFVHATTSRCRAGPSIGVDLDALSRRVDGLIAVLFGQDTRAARATVAELSLAVARRVALLASIRISELSRPRDASEMVSSLTDAGASGFRYYNYGLSPRHALRSLATAISGNSQRNWGGP